MTWNESLLSPAPPTILRVLFWHLKNVMASWNHSWAPADWLACRLPVNFRCLRSCLRRDRWYLCRWMNTLLCALPFGLNISVSNVTNQIFVSCYVQPLCMLLGDLLYLNSHWCWWAQLKYMDKLYTHLGGFAGCFYSNMIAFSGYMLLSIILRIECLQLENINKSLI